MTRKKEKLFPYKKGNKNSKKLETGLFVLSFAFELGFTVSIPIVGGALLGAWLDERLLTAPRLTLSLIFLGTFLGFWNLYFLTKKTTKIKK